MIIQYGYDGMEYEPWLINKCSYGRINLLVGATGSGKTRFLNTLFNFASTVVKGTVCRAGKWEIVVSINQDEYSWYYEGAAEDKEETFSSNVYIERELISIKNENKEETLVDRTPEKFIFEDVEMPKLQKDRCSVTLLKEEGSIQPLYDVFAKMLRRRFQDDSLSGAISLEPISKDLLKRYRRDKNLTDIMNNDHQLNAKMLIMREVFPKLYDASVNTFKSIFPTIENIEIRDISDTDIPVRTNAPVPSVVFKEKGLKQEISLLNLSSGMQKVLLLIVDILLLPKNAIYIIDEYENSLGVNAIDFLPEFLLEHNKHNQFFITTHHPYLINNMPIKNWRVFHRKGSEVSVKLGEELEKKYGSSKQQAFIKLINDSYYNKGIE